MTSSGHVTDSCRTVRCISIEKMQRYSKSSRHNRRYFWTIKKCRRMGIDCRIKRSRNGSHRVSLHRCRSSLIYVNLTPVSMGLFIGTIYDNMMEYITGKHHIKYQLFSGHDGTIAPLLGALELYDGKWPPFASHVNFELYKNATASRWSSA